MQPRQIATALLFLALSACTAPGDGGNQSVATVDGEAITVQTLKRSLRVGEAGEDRAGTDYSLTRDGLRRVLDQEIERRLLLRAAERHGIKIGDKEVDRALARMRDGWEPGDFAATLASQGMSEEDVRRNLAERLSIERLYADEVMARVAVTDDEIAAWLEAHQEELQRPEQVRATQIVVKTEEEAADILSRLKKGESFEELARAHSLSPDGKKGGDLGFFARGEMPPPFDDVCFALSPGQLSEVVSSSYGFHVFRLLERRSAKAPGPERLKLEAEKRLRREKEASAWQVWLERLHDAADIEIDEAALERLMGSQ